MRSRRSLSRLLLVALLFSVAAPSVAPIASAPVASTGTTGTGTGTNGTAPASGDPTVVACEQVQRNPTGEGPDYRVVRGGCSIDLSDGEILSNVRFKARGAEIDVRASGSGWTIRNVAITGHGAPDDSPLDLRVESRDGVGLVRNVWASDLDSNAVFVHATHRGTIRFDEVTFLRVGEDGAYASRPGNPSRVTPQRGGGGIVGFDQAYVKNVGTGPKAGYGVRLSSDGSYLTNSTVVSSTGPAVANTFAGGKHPNQHPDAFEGVLVRNVSIVTEGIGIRLNNHQDDLAPRRRWTSITHLRNVRIDAGQPIQRNEAGGVDPVINGTYGTNPDPSPPPGAPRSPELAASGIGGGTGSIGGPVDTGPVDGIGTAVGIVILTALIVVGALALVYRLATD